MQFVGEAWQKHPFHPDNNVNDTGRHVGTNGGGLAIHTLAHPGITALQTDLTADGRHVGHSVPTERFGANT